MIPAASVIIPVRNAEAVLGDQLAALSRQVDAPQFEVVVVLNRCADHSGLVADSYRSRLPLTVLTADEKAGPAYARNVGAARSSAPHLLFCDADDRVGEGWVRAMVRALLAWARSEEGVRTVRASIGPDNEASLATIRPFGFERTGEQWDEDDGLEIVHELAL